MRCKTSITLSEETMRAVTRLAGPSGRSRLIEEAIVAYLRTQARSARDERDREILDRRASALNEEIADVLRFQVRL
jgi:predicted transcriptional regulator